MKLCEVYESERIFDKFDLQVSPDSRMVLTGGYHSHAHVIDLQRRINTTLQVQFLNKRGKQCGVPRNYKNKRLLGTVPATPTTANTSIVKGPNDKQEDITMTDLSQSNNSNANKSAAAVDPSSLTPSNDLSQRICMGSWHPKENTFAVAKHNSLFVYTEKRSIGSSNDRKDKPR